MNVSMADAREELRGVVRQFLADRSSETEVRRVMGTEDAYDPVVWKVMAEQLGLQGIAIPEEHGGSGSGFAELGVALEEMGASLLCSPFLSTVVLGANALLLSGDEAAAREWLPRIVTGELLATVALPHRTLSADGGEPPLTASADGDGGWTLDGEAHWVLDGTIADVLLMFAQTATGMSLFAVEGDAPGLERTPVSTIDETRRLALIRCAAVTARPLGDLGSSGRIAAQLREIAAAALSCEQVGGAQHALDMAVSYVKVRHQFGRPIGAFQAIKHRCAELLVEVESARSAARHAVACLDERNADSAGVTSLAKAVCSDTFRHVTAENIQLHGGIGFTWEHPAHLYYKRAAVSAVLFGDANEHRELFVRSLES